MSRYSKLGKVGLVLGIAGLVLGGSVWVQNVLRIDPFAAYREDSAPSRFGIEIGKSKMRYWDRGKLVASAKIDSLMVSNDRHWLEFAGINDGLIRHENKTYNFSADSGTFDHMSRRLNVSGGAHIVGKDFDLKTESFGYDQYNKRIEVKSPISGKLKGGTLQANDLRMDLQKDVTESSGVRWKGAIKNLQGTALPVRQDDDSVWTFEGSFRQEGDIIHYKNAVGTDGEILIRAPEVEHNRVTDVVTATGKVYYFSAKANLVCEKAVIYRAEKKAVLTGDVRMLVKPEDKQVFDPNEDMPPYQPKDPSKLTELDEQQKELEDELRTNKTVRKYPAKVKSDKIVYWYEEGQRRAEITGSPEAYQDLQGGTWRRVWAHHAFYDGEKDTLKLESEGDARDVKMLNSIGDDGQGRTLLVSTKEGDDSMTGQDFRLKAKVRKEQLPTPPGGSGGGSTGGGG